MIVDFFEKLLKRNKELKSNENEIRKSRLFAHINVHEVMEKIDREKDILYLPTAFCLLLSSNIQIKESAATSINNLVMSLPINRLMVLDALFRDRSSLDWSYDWRTEEPTNLIAPSMSEQEVITILGLCSFHPNGYFREKAIKELEKVVSGYEIPYLLIRLNDWVGVVRDAAKAAVLERLKPSYASVIIENLPLIYRLSKCSRDMHQELIEMTIKMLISNEARQCLVNGLESENSQVRTLCYEIIAKYELLESSKYIGLLIKEPNPHTRLHALRQVTDKIFFDDFRYFSEYLLHDKYAPIRLLAYELYDKYLPSESKSLLTNALLDKHISVRETARYLLKTKGIKDFSAFYIDALNEGFSYGAICGLGETGKEDDAAYLINFLDLEQAKIVRIAIRALSKLAFEEFKDTFIELLADDRMGVSKEARLALSGRISSADADKIYKLSMSNDKAHTRKNGALLLCSISKWDSISYIIEICADKDEEISRIGKYNLDKWISKFNRSFTVPTRDQVKRIESAIKTYENTISKSSIEWIEIALDSLK